MNRSFPRPNARRGVVQAAVALLLVGTASARSLVEASPLDRAQSAARAFSTSLKATLSSRIAEDGLQGAVGFCHAEAPKIAERIGAEHGVRIGRVPVAGRQRNPANAATDWQAVVLAGFQRNVAAGAKPGDQVHVQVVDLPDGVALRMMRGIAVEPLCLACHGRSPSPDALDAIARYYPGDTATGFDAGDLRGALWVEVPATPTKEPRP